MKNILTIMKKEFLRFFKDKRLVISLFLPGVLIYCIYSFLGTTVFSDLMGTDENYVGKVYAVNMPEEFRTAFDSESNAAAMTVTYASAEGDEFEEIVSSFKEKVSGQEIDLLAVFPADFAEKYAAAKAAADAGEPLMGYELPAVELYYNTIRTEASSIYAAFSTVLSLFQPQVSGYFGQTVSDLATGEDVTGMIFSMIGPMIILVFLFAGCISVAPESIAGEKERGTFATMLVTPVKRSHIAVGKIISLSVLSVLSGICSFLGIVFSLPKLMAGVAGDGMGISAAVYGFGDYLMLLGVILTTVLVIVSLVSVLSTLAKSTKEATGMVSPLMIVVVLLGISTMFGGSGASPFLYLIPLYNSALAMSGVFSFAGSALNVLITMAVNVVAAVLLSVLLAKMFDNEKIIFNK